MKKSAILIFTLLFLAYVNISTGFKGVDWDFIWSSGDNSNILWYLRLPRTISAIMIGAGLSLAGAALQGIFKNPLVEPGIIGASGGAALIEVLGITGLYSLPFAFDSSLYLRPLLSFTGSLLVVFLVYRIASKNAYTEVTLFILAGVAINAFAAAGINLILSISTAEELRQFTFWTFGSIGLITWKESIIVSILVCISSFIIWKNYRSLDTLLLGEQNAFYLGTPVEKVKRSLLIFCSLTIGACVAFAGIIGFVGLVVPHIARMIVGHSHKKLLPLSLLIGACLMLFSDLISKTIIAPTELPVGTITAMIGAPYFIWLIFKRKKMIAGR